MITRRKYIEQIRRLIYGGMPNNDAEITENLVNQWLEQAIAVAAKANYKDNIAIDGIGYVNGSFYTKFRGLSISSDGNFTWKISMPQIPVGIGANQGISTLELRDSSGNVTKPFIPISENQRTYYQNMRPIPNKILYYYQGEYLYFLSSLILSSYTGDVTMVSGGDSSNLDSTLNVPPDYFPVMTEYLRTQLSFERNVPQDVQNDGLDAVRTT